MGTDLIMSLRQVHIYQVGMSDTRQGSFVMT
jgi:hypothetical protein